MIENKMTGELYSKFPVYGKHSFSGRDYGYLVVTLDKRVLYFSATLDGESDCEDVTEHFNLAL